MFSHNSEACAAPLVSVIVPVWNGAQTIERCLDSVCTFGGGITELVVCDGGSTDGTVHILRRRAGEIARWCSEPDNGLYDAMNKGVTLARGRWVLFLGADDVLREGFAAMADHLVDADSVYYGDVWMPHRGLLYGGAFSPARLAKDNICHQAIFYPKALLQAHPYDLSYRVSSDYATNILCFKDERWSWSYRPCLVSEFTDHGGISATTLDPQFAGVKLRLILRHLGIRPFLYGWWWSRRRALLKTLRRSAMLRRLLPGQANPASKLR